MQFPLNQIEIDVNVTMNKDMCIFLSSINYSKSWWSMIVCCVYVDTVFAMDLFSQVW